MDHLRPTTPCPKRWGDLDGQGTIRHCGACQLHVTNLSQLTRDDAQSFLGRSSGRTCIAVELRADGTTAYRDAEPPRAFAGAWRRAIAAALPAFLLPWLPGCGGPEPGHAPDPTPGAVPQESPELPGSGEPQTTIPGPALQQLVGRIQVMGEVDLLDRIPHIGPNEEQPPIMGGLQPEEPHLE